MQDLDLYTGKPGPLYTHQAPRFEAPDAEYFSRINDSIQGSEHKSRRHATRIFSVVAGLCIVAFTAGLIIGIKFAGGKDKALIDPHTQKAFSDLTKAPVEAPNTAGAQSSVETSAQSAPQNSQTTVASTYPKAEFPFVIRLGADLAKEKADEAASFLSGKGHTVILSKNGQSFRLYSGPFRTMESAEISLQKIRSYGDSRFAHTQVIKR
jgi:hypothetical protein